MKRFVYGILPLMILCISTYVFGQGNVSKNIIHISKSEKMMEYVPGEIIVKFKQNTINLKTAGGKINAKKFADTKNMKISDSIDGSNITVLKIEETENILKKILELQSDPNIEYAELNYIYRTMSFDDTYSGNLRGIRMISGYDAFRIFSGNPDPNITGTIVAVIDAGVAYDHPDLTNQMWNGTNCKDQNGNVLGGCIYGYDFADNDKNPYPVRENHGTHVAGTIAAQANNNRGILGVNFNARIMAIRVGDNTMTISDIVKGIDFARQNGAKIINASFGGPGYSISMDDAINAFRSAGGLFVAAAGNSSYNHTITSSYPCDYTLDNIICVAATDANNNLASFSDYGTIAVDIGAPGTSIYSTIANIVSATSMSETFESVLTGTIPDGWTTGGNGSNIRGVWDIGGDRGHVLYGDLNYPYSNNVNSTIQTSVDTSNASGVTLDVWTMCDTQYITDGRADYMALEVSANGIQFTEIGRWDEAYLDDDLIEGDNTGGVTYGHLIYDLTGAYASSDFVFRFRRVSNTSDNSYYGCLIDDVVVKKYTANTTNEPYGYKQGTSMATPHVAGLASLARSMRPELGYSEIRSVIIGSGDSIASLSGKTVSGKRINAYKTLIALDNIAPTATVIYSTTGWTSGDVVATLTGFSEELTGLNATGYTFTGNGSFQFTFADLAGNTGSVTATVDRIDRIAPTAIVQYSRTGLTNQDVIATITGEWETITGILTYIFTGNGSFPFTFTDLAGNTGSVTATVDRIDKIAPTATVQYSITGLTKQDVIATITGEWETITGILTYIFTGNGSFQFTFTDLAGNTGSVTATVTWIDKTKPTATIVYTPSQATSGTVIALLTGFSKEFSGANATGYIFTGNGSFQFIFTDVIGNTGHATATVTWILPFVDADQLTGSTIVTGQVGIGGATATGIIFTTTGTLQINSGSHAIMLQLSGLRIQAVGGDRDGTLMPPTPAVFSGTPPTYTNHTHQAGLTFQIGNPQLELILQEQLAMIHIHVGASYNGKILRVYRSANHGATYTFINTCTVSGSICSFTSEQFSLFTLMTPTTTNTSPGGGNPGGGTTSESTTGNTNSGTIDDCPDGDFSPSTRDGTCQENLKIMKKTGSIIGSKFSTEMNNAYLYAYDIGITTMDTIQQANMTGSLIRAHMAKMMVNYAIKVLNKTINTGTKCDFPDIADQSSEMRNYIVRACQLGLMGVNTSKFNPKGEVTRAQFGTVLSRALYGDKHDGGLPYYLDHLSALKMNNIITNTTPDLKELRGYVMLMLMRSVETN